MNLCAETRFAISVSIGQEAVTDPTGIDHSFKMRFPTCGGLAGENNNSKCRRVCDAPAFGKCLRQLAFIKCDVVRRVAQVRASTMHERSPRLWERASR